MENIVKKFVSTFALILILTSTSFAENQAVQDVDLKDDGAVLIDSNRVQSEIKQSVQICELEKSTKQQRMGDRIDFQKRYLRRIYNVI